MPPEKFGCSCASILRPLVWAVSKRTVLNASVRLPYSKVSGQRFPSAVGGPVEQWPALRHAASAPDAGVVPPENFDTRNGASAVQVVLHPFAATAVIPSGEPRPGLIGGAYRHTPIVRRPEGVAGIAVRGGRGGKRCCRRRDRGAIRGNPHHHRDRPAVCVCFAFA